MMKDDTHCRDNNVASSRLRPHPHYDTVNKVSVELESQIRFQWRTNPNPTAEEPEVSTD